MKVRVTLTNETTQNVSSDGPIALGVEGGVLTLYGTGGKWLATFGPGCWLSAVDETPEH